MLSNVDYNVVALIGSHLDGHDDRNSMRLTCRAFASAHWTFRFHAINVAADVDVERIRTRVVASKRLKPGVEIIDFHVTSVEAAAAVVVAAAGCDYTISCQFDDVALNAGRTLDKPRVLNVCNVLMPEQLVALCASPLMPAVGRASVVAPMLIECDFVKSLTEHPGALFVLYLYHHPLLSARVFSQDYSENVSNISFYNMVYECPAYATFFGMSFPRLEHMTFATLPNFVYHDASSSQLDAALSSLFRKHPDMSLYFFDQCLMNPCIIFVLKKLLSLGANGKRLFAQPSMLSPHVDREIACARLVRQRHVPQFQLIHPFSERAGAMDDPCLGALFGG